jgi:hypothetical protein
MQTNARMIVVAFAALALAACAGPSAGPSKPGGAGGSTGTGGNGGSTGTGGDGSGGTGGSGGGGTANGGAGGGGGGGTGGAGGGGGTTTSGVGCKSYVNCLAAAMSAADSMACDTKASANAKSILDAEETCIGSYCLGMSGAAARCKQSATDGSMQNLDGTAAFDATTGAPTGDCGACLLNGDAALWGEACMPTTDAACNTTACSQQTMACVNDG